MTRLLTIVMLIACFALAACADNDKRSDNGPFNGWYTGFGGGGQ